MGMFDNIGKASVTKKGNWFHTGSFLVMNQKVTLNPKTRKGCAAFILEHLVMAVLDCPAEIEPSKRLRPGQKATHMTTSDKEGFEGNVKGMVSEMILCRDPADNPDAYPVEAWANLMDEKGPILGEKQAFAGLLMVAVAQQVTTQKGKDFTRIEYKYGVTAQQARDLLKTAGVEELILFPGGELQKMIDAEAAKAAEAAPLPAA